jgi:dethiobiotin synthetase
MNRGCFVTGTDTEIGKTCVSAGLLHLLARSGLRSAGCKPVAAGTSLLEGRDVNEDVLRLREAGSVPLRDDEVGPYQFAAACAPHVAAALEGRRIERRPLVDAVRAVQARAEVTVVEGVGGFCVPLSIDGDASFDTADLAADLGLPVVLVVGLRLGCLNHAVLTAEAVRHRGLRLVGWVANTVDPAMAQFDANLAALHDALGRRHRAACLGVVPRLEVPTAAAVAAHLDLQAVRAALA